MEQNENDLKVIDLTNANKSRLQIMNYGATIFSFKIRNNRGELIDIVVGPQDPSVYLSEEYRSKNKCFGATIGRFAGRISNAKFNIEEEEYKVTETSEDVHIHGGKEGFQYKFWKVEKIDEGKDPFVELSYTSENLEEGYPGRLQVKARYTLTEEDNIEILYSAKTDKDTIVNLTNHTYFNLNGGGSVSDHFLQVNASKILELDNRNLPTGDLKKLKKHPKDYRENKLLGNRLLDDFFITGEKEETQVQLFAPLTGIKMKVSSNQPGVVIYSPETLPEEWTYNATIDPHYPAIAIEAQNYPDSPNFRNFPSSLLKAGNTYENRIRFEFSVK